jgi:cytochrome c oxidase assembly protein subunit 15
VASVLNMLILGSLLSGSRANEVVPSALWWIPGAIVAGGALGSAGAGMGSRGRDGTRARARKHGWTAGFALVAAAATLLLLVAGGLVTSHGAGLAVVDWPNSYGYSMFLYPLVRMTGGIYYEHAHRLFGALVGLTTLVLAIHLLRVEPRRWVRGFALGALALVLVQGLLGGLRVTGHLTTSTSPEVMRPSLLLAVVHGIAGQIFFAAMVALSAFTSVTWRSDRPPTRSPAASTDRGLSIVLAAALLVQLVLGAVLRHTSQGLITHIMMAVIVTVLAVAGGARLAGLERGQPILRRTGVAILVIVGAQVALGIGSLVVSGLARGADAPPAWEVLVTTAHQATGAILLAAATLGAAWTRRLLDPART